MGMKHPMVAQLKQRNQVTAFFLLTTMSYLIPSWIVEKHLQGYSFVKAFFVIIDWNPITCHSATTTGSGLMGMRVPFDLEAYNLITN